MRNLDPNEFDEDRLAQEVAEAGAGVLVLGILFLVAVGIIIALVIGSWL
jgi:hypothetical protein